MHICTAIIINKDFYIRRITEIVHFCYEGALHGITLCRVITITLGKKSGRLLHSIGMQKKEVINFALKNVKLNEHKKNHRPAITNMDTSFIKLKFSF